MTTHTDKDAQPSLEGEIIEKMAIAASHWYKNEYQKTPKWDELTDYQKDCYRSQMKDVYAVVQAAVAERDAVIEVAEEALKPFAFKTAKNIRLVWTDPPATMPVEEFGEVVGILSGPWHSHTETPSMHKSILNARQALSAIEKLKGAEVNCKADRDGDCTWKDCPQTRDNEPQKSNRHCPLDKDEDDE